MATVLGSECNVWLVAGLLILALGLAGALLAAVRETGVRRDLMLSGFAESLEMRERDRT